MSLLNGSLSSRAVLVGLVAGIALMSLVPSFAEGEKPGKYWVFVGTYTGAPNNSKGIYRFDFDPATGRLSHRALAAETKNPSFLAIHPNHRFLYAVGELE